MADQTLRWGILGAARFARQHMAPAIHAAAHADLAGLATSSADKFAEFARFAPGLQHFTSYEDLLADPSIDAVYIPLPNHLHVEWAIKALQAGKHVLCEKPVGMDVGQIDQLIAVRDATGLLAAEAYMIVHHPQWQRAKQLLAEGAIGDLHHVNAVFTFRNLDGGNIRNQADMGGGGLRDIGVYTMGSARWATGQEPVKMTHAHLTLDNGVDTHADVGFAFPGFSYQGYTSIRMANRQEVHFHGSEAVMTLSCPFNANVFDQGEIHLKDPNGKTVTERFPGANHYVQQVENFGRSVRDGAAYPWTLEDARGTQSMLDQILATVGS